MIENQSEWTINIYSIKHKPSPGADPGFQVRGAHLKKLRRAEGGANIFGVFRVKNHIFSNFRGGGGPPRPGSAPALNMHIIRCIGNQPLNTVRIVIRFGQSCSRCPGPSGPRAELSYFVHNTLSSVRVPPSSSSLVSVSHQYLWLYLLLHEWASVNL